MFAKEIWSLSGPFWVLPVSVEWPEGQRDIAAIRIGGGIKLLDVQREVAVERLKAIGAEFYNNRWMLMRPLLEKFCSPEGWIDPETIVEWRPLDRVKYRSVPAGERERYKNLDEFFHEFSKTGWINNPYKAEVLWMAFCKHALHWLVNEQKPVDMGFCTLFPLPVRANWKSLLLQRHIEYGTELNLSKLIWPIAEEIFDPQFNAWDKRKRHIYWTLEVLPGRAWFRATIRYERARKYRNGRLKGELKKYAGAIKDSIKRSLPQLAKCYAAYLSQIKKPGARLAAELLASGKASQAARRGRCDPVRVPPAAVVPSGYDARVQAQVPPVELGDPEQENSGVRDVSDLRQKAEDVRESNRPSDV